MKISEKLTQTFADMIEEDADTMSASILLSMSAMAWNMAVDPEVGMRQWESLHSRLSPAVPPDMCAKMRELIEILKERKLSLFPDDLRLITRTGVQPQRGGGFHFTAIASGNEDGSGR